MYVAIFPSIVMAYFMETKGRVRNAYLDLNTQAWYADAVGKYDQYNLTSSHVQNVIKGDAIKGISDTDAYKDNDMIKQFEHAESVIESQIPGGTAIGFEHGPSTQAGILTNQHIIEKMFQDIITNGTDVEEAAQAAEDELNALFEAVQ